MNKFWKFLIVTIGIFSLLVLSELIYGKNIPKMVSYIYFERAKKAAARGEAQVAIDLISKGAKVNMNLSKKRGKLGSFLFQRVDNNPKLDIIFYDYPGVVDLNEDKELNQAIIRYLNSIPSEIFLSDNYDFARVLYDLGIIANKNGSVALFPRLVKGSINLRPDQSNWYMELANFYHRYDQDDDARSVLHICAYIATDGVFCAGFNDNIVKEKPPLDTGFLIDETEESYHYPSHIK